MDISSIRWIIRKVLFVKKLKDTLINRSTLELIIPKVTKVQATYGDRVQKMKERLLVAAINARFTAFEYACVSIR